MNINRETNVIQLIENLGDAEDMKHVIEIFLEESNVALKKANFIDRLFMKKSLKDWVENKERCEQDISDYDAQISIIREELYELGYDSDDIKKIKDALRPGSGFLYHLEQDHPWVKLLTKQEKASLLVEITVGRYEGYSSLMAHTSYIDSFKTVAEKLDFIHGFLPDFKIEGKQTDAYKIGELFQEVGFGYNYDIERALRDYAPKYRHDLEFVSLVHNLEYELSNQAMVYDSLTEPFFAGCSPDDLNNDYTEALCDYKKRQEVLGQEIKVIKKKTSAIQEKINEYKFFGKIEFLCRDRQDKTIVGETIYYDNYKDYKQEIDESHDCGRPISACNISKEEYLTERMKEAGYEPTFVKGFSDDFLIWKETFTGKEFGLDGWFGVKDFLESKDCSRPIKMNNKSLKKEIKEKSTFLEASERLVIKNNNMNAKQKINKPKKIRI